MLLKIVLILLFLAVLSGIILSGFKMYRLKKLEKLQ